MLSLTTVSETAVLGTLPILYRKDLELDESDRANRCYAELLQQCTPKGYFPYRLPVTFQQEFYNRFKDKAPLSRRIKEALDPDGVLAPGRYISPFSK